jgi:hypothetical protein
MGRRDAIVRNVFTDNRLTVRVVDFEENLPRAVGEHVEVTNIQPDREFATIGIVHIHADSLIESIRRAIGPQIRGCGQETATQNDRGYGSRH